MSTSWHNEYLSALATRDKTEHQNKTLYEAYTTLASRKSQPSTQSHAKDEPATSPAPPLSPSNRVMPWSRTGAGSPTPASAPAPTLAARWQEELSEAQRRRAELESGLGAAKTELERERTRAVVAERRVTELAIENAGLTVKLRDRVEELRAKAKLVQDVHDESVALNLQLNISEERNAKLEKENKELVDRWMARMGKEADALNDASKFS